MINLGGYFTNVIVVTKFITWVILVERREVWRFANEDAKAVGLEKVYAKAKELKCILRDIYKKGICRTYCNAWNLFVLKIKAYRDKFVNYVSDSLLFGDYNEVQ